MNYIKLSLLVFLIFSFSCIASEQIFGVVSSNNGVLCVSFGEKPPSIGSSITIIETQSPQYFFEGKLSTTNENCKVLEKAEVIGPYFTVITVRKVGSLFIGVAVSGKNAVSVKNNEVVITANASKEQFRFRSCTSNEGLHLTSWLGQPLKSEELWRVYYYLGYDVEPSCEENDFQK